MQRNDSRAGFENAAKDRQRRFRDASPTVSNRARWPADDTVLIKHTVASGSAAEYTAVVIGSVDVLVIAAAVTGVTVLVKNTGQTSLASGLPLRSGAAQGAQAFTTGDNSAGYTLSSIGADIDNIPSTATPGADLKVTLNTVSVTHPGSVLCTLTDAGELQLVRRP